MSIIGDSITIKNAELAAFFRCNVRYNAENLLLHAVKESMQNKMNKIEISREELVVFYQEYQDFQNYKKNLFTAETDNMKRFKTSISRMKFSTLEAFFVNKLNIKQETHTCSFCGFSCSTLKGITTHKRNCSSNPDSKSKVKKSGLTETVNTNIKVGTVEEEEDGDEEDDEELL